MIHLIDSNVYIHGFRDSAFGETLRQFHQKHLPHLVLSAVVAHELLVGAANAARERLLRRGLVEPFRTRQRLHVPAWQTWEMAANIDLRLRKRIENAFGPKLQTRSFANDILIAATARELGAIILTDNSADFRASGRLPFGRPPSRQHSELRGFTTIGHAVATNPPSELCIGPTFFVRLCTARVPLIGDTQIRKRQLMAARRLHVRFRIGDSVEILPTIHSGFIGMAGTVIAVMENAQARTLDEYRVRLANFEEEVFWDIQLRYKPEHGMA